MTELRCCLVLWTCAVTVTTDKPTIEEGMGRILMAKTEDVTFERSYDIEYSRLAGFTWNTCNTYSSVVHVETLFIDPDPLEFPGPVNISSTFTTDQQLQAPLKADVVLKMRIGSGFVQILCIENVGSCTYDDICPLIGSIIDPWCPDVQQMIHIDCECPFRMNSYVLLNGSFKVDSMVLSPGEYHFRVNITHNETNVLCLDLNFSLL